MDTIQVDERDMRKAWSTLWWIVLIQGILALLFGLYMLFNPQNSVTIMVKIFALFIMIDGFLEIVGSFMERKYLPNWGWRMLGGVLVIIAGLVFWGYSSFISTATVAILIWIIAIALLISGISALVQALRGRRTNPWSAILWGAVKIFFAILLMTQTGASSTVLLWIFGAFLVLSGILAIILAFQLRSFVHELEDRAAVVIEAASNIDRAELADNVAKAKNAAADAVDKLD